MLIIFHHRVASRDGQAVHIEELLAALQEQGHETILVGPPAFTATRFGGESHLVSRIKRSIPAVLYEILELAYNARAFLRLYSAVRKSRPDVIYERFSLFLFAGIWVRKLTGTPLLLEVNSPLFEERARNDGLRLHRMGRWAQRLIWNQADYVLPVTGVLGRNVAAYGVPEARIAVIPNGINPTRFNGAPDSGAAKAALGLTSRVVLGFTGFVREWNAVQRLIGFVARNRSRFDAHILVVGDGPARQSLQENATAQGIADRLTITGTVMRDDVARYIAAFDVAVLPAVTPYSSPLKLFEYMQLGRAIVGPDSENIREILTHEKNALLFDPTQSGAIDTALLRLCSDAGLRARLGAAALETIATKSLTWSRNAERVGAIAGALMNTSGQHSATAHTRPGKKRKAAQL